MLRRAARNVTVGLPAWIYVPAAAGALFVILPLVAIIGRIDWAHFVPLVTSESSRTALVLSLKTATASTGVCVLLGCPWRSPWRAAQSAWSRCCGR